MSAQAPIDRRIFERLEGDFSGRYCVKNIKEIQGEFKGLNFSAGGIMVDVDKKIVEGRVLELSLVSQTNSAIQTTGQIVWQREIKPGRWQAGVKFYQADLIHLWPLIVSNYFTLSQKIDNEVDGAI